MELWVPRPLSVRLGQSYCGLLALPEEDKAEWYTGIPVLVHWVAIAMFCIAAIGFALCVCLSVI